MTGDNNYNSAASKDLEFTIAKAGSSLVITTDNMDKSYDGQAVSNPDVEKEGTTNTVTFTWYKKDGNRWTELNEAPVNAGNYKVVAAVQGDDNYNGTETEKTFEITKAMPTYTVPEDLIIKQGEVLSTVTLPDGFAWNNSTQPADDLGTQIFKATFTPADTTNYQTVEVDIRIEVVPAVSTINRMPEITAEDKILTVGDTFDPKKDVTATDKEDGDVTDKIEVIKNNVDTAEAGTYEVTYKVTDSEGASSAKTIAVTVNPKMETLNEIPMITAEDKILTIGDTFDPKKDVTATDKEDGDVTDKIEVISNNVDTSKAGIYEVIYKVTDSQGASTTKTVIVTVREKINSQILDKGNDRTGNKTDKLSQSDKIQKAVKTGDTNIVNIVLWSALSFISVIGVLLTILFRRRRH